MPHQRAIANSITNLLVCPSKVANKLDWKKRVGGALLSVHLGDTSIDLASIFHPSQPTSIHRFASVPLEFEIENKQKVLKRHIPQQISNIVRDNNICGLVVSWPVQKEGWCGASCGKVLHILDQIVQETNIVTKDRPVCLWDGHHFRLPEDEWGRVPFYGVPSPNRKQVHLASQEQYRDCGMVAAGIVQDYVRHYWPDLVHNLFVDEYESSTAEIMTAASSSKRRQVPLVDPRWLASCSGSTNSAKALA